MKEIIRHHRFKILTVICLIILLIFSISQFKTREMYKAHISQELQTDFQQLVTSIQDNNKYYNEILNTGIISNTQANSLMSNNERIRDMILKYRRLAVELNMRKEEFQYDKSSLNAIQITRLFYDWNHESKLDLKTKNIINKVQELTSMWNSEINLEGNQFSLSNTLWLELLENLEESTLAYIKENNIESIEDIWLKRTEIE